MHFTLDYTSRTPEGCRWFTALLYSQEDVNAEIARLKQCGYSEIVVDFRP
jgi:hypothetical protein